MTEFTRQLEQLGEVLADPYGRRLAHAILGTADAHEIRTALGMFVNQDTAISSSGVRFRTQQRKGVWRSGIRDCHTP